MPVTTREDILKKLLAIYQTVPDITTIVRNRGLMTNEMRPAIVLMDGDEQEGLRPPRNGRGGSSVVYRTTKVMRPQTFVLLRTAAPTNKDSAGEDVGTKLNEYRVEIVRRVLDNTDLRALLGSNGSLNYVGSETDLRSGAAMAGQIRVDFTITYVFDPRV